LKKLFLALLVSCASTSVDIISPNGEVIHAYGNVTIASTPDERAQGLVGHAPLDDDEAMVLAYPNVDQACITNADVDFPITAIFVAANETIVAVESLDAHDARIPCHDAVLDVIEVDASGASVASDASKVTF
jgi:uncharacterized membrane protein (UPF0127 family)